MENMVEGKYRIIWVDGTEIIISEKPNDKSINKAIGCDCTDSVDLKGGQVMIVDDAGQLKGLPVNKKASALASQRLGRTYTIYGIAVIANDRDFA
jgi:hypothetical protein